jgi:hypothetical protein
LTIAPADILLTIHAIASLNPIKSVDTGTSASSILRLFAMRHINQNNNQNNRFEYETLPTEQRAEIQKLTIEIRDNLRQTIATIWQIGEKLAAVRSQIDLWQFTAWLKAEFDWSRSTAYNFMSVYQAFPDLSHLTVGRVDITISALYLLAASSTPPEIRSHFLELANAGEPISRKAVRKFIAHTKAISAERAADRLAMPEIPPTEDVCVHPIPIESGSVETTALSTDLAATGTALINADLEAVKLASELEQDGDTTASDLRPAWNSIDREFSLFWGDTNSPRFTERLPKDGFVLAIPSRQWHHDWLLKEPRSRLVLTEPKLEPELVTGFLSVISAGEKALIFPWLPSWQMVELALNLNLRVYAGDPSLKYCEQTISNLGFDLRNISRDFR